MHIVIVTGPFLPVPPAPSGAVERIWQELAEEFASQGHEVSFLCRTHPSQRSEETLSGVRYVRRMRFRRGRNVYLDIVKDFFYSFRWALAIPDADIVVTNTFWLPVLLPMFRRRRAKIVANVARMPKGQLAWYRRADRLAAVSRAVLDEIARQSPRLASKAKLIANPVDTNIFAPPSAPRAEAIVPTVLYVGRIHPEKGVHLLIAAWRNLHAQGLNTRLVIVGPVDVDLGGGGASYFDSLRRESAGLPVEFVPPVFDKRALVNFYHEATVFCYPSLAERGESFGMAPLEAMATGLVPVVSDLACFRDFVEPGVSGVVFDHRGRDAVLELAKTLRDLLSSSEELRRMSATALNVSRSFDRARIANRYLDDFRALTHRVEIAHGH